MIGIKTIPLDFTSTHYTNIPAPAGYTEYNHTSSYDKGSKIIYKCHQYICDVNNTTEIYPNELNQTNWLPEQICNKGALFDYSPSSVSISSTDIVASIIDDDSTATAIAIFGMNGIKYQLKIIETIGNTTVYDTGEVDMVETSNITDWYSFFFNKRDRKKNLVIYGLPPQIQSKAELTVFADPNTGGAQVAGMFYGEEKLLGKATWGTKLGIESKSTYNETVFGTEILKRGSEQYINTTLEIPAIDTPRLMANMKEMKDEVYPYFIPGKEESSLTLGYFKDFNIVLELPTRNLVNLEIKGVL